MNRPEVLGLEGCGSQADVRHLIAFRDWQAREPARSAGPASGLVRLETSDTQSFRVLDRVEAHRRRGLKMFKSLSCVGDMLKNERDEQGRLMKRAFITLTYREDDQWNPKQITALFKAMRVWLGRRGVKLRYLWVAEQTKRGRVHYHAMVWLPRGLTLPKPDRQGWWPYGFTNVQWARKGIGYLIKYATKGGAVEQPWPKGCRLHGHGGLSAERRVRRSWWMLPRYIRVLVEPEWRVHRARGGGWASRITGEWWPAWCGPVSAPVGAGVVSC